jgi:glucose-1-phosphate adenylyltransferase
MCAYFLNHDFEYALISIRGPLMMDFNDMLEEHIKSQADISIATYQ